ncbi:hypothetical protein ANN_07672 [Periplaneta americana]|uniref:Uncharacterized protein n=1 Tax=Periplaneta americana TaxID=6978 RepID=A0ABQ8T0M5_PERAM|nr:hypothetical protein ANN_07672 [Periplaneta americana]
MAGLCEGGNEPSGSLKAIYIGRQRLLKCVKGTRCCPVCTVVQQGEIESIPASSYGVNPSALRFPRVREASPSVLCADDPCSKTFCLGFALVRVLGGGRKEMLS